MILSNDSIFTHSRSSDYLDLAEFISQNLNWLFPFLGTDLNFNQYFQIRKRLSSDSLDLAERHLRRARSRRILCHPS